MADQIPDSGLLLQPAVSHFSLLQDPEQFSSHVLHFLQYVRESDVPSGRPPPFIVGSSETVRGG